MNRFFVKDYDDSWSIDSMPAGCLFYDNQENACMKVHYPGKTDSDSCYYVNLRTSYFYEVPRECMFNIIRSKVTVKTVW